MGICSDLFTEFRKKSLNARSRNVKESEKKSGSGSPLRFMGSSMDLCTTCSWKLLTVLLTIKQANRQTNADESVTSLAKVLIWVWVHVNVARCHQGLRKYLHIMLMMTSDGETFTCVNKRSRYSRDSFLKLQTCFPGWFSNRGAGTHSQEVATSDSQ